MDLPVTGRAPAAIAFATLACALRYEDLPAAVVTRARHLILDTLGCAFGGVGSEPSRIAREVAASRGGNPVATVIGTATRTDAADAALLNGVAVRYLDFMDMYRGRRDGCHPSENIPVALAVAEAEGRSGADAILATVLGFEFQMRFADCIPGHALDWHHVTHAGYVTPLVAGLLIGLDAGQLAHAIGIGGCHNHALADLLGDWWAGTGQISMMKAIGYGFGAQSGIQAAMLAGRGFTGPVTIIESFNRVVAGSGDIEALREPIDSFRILRSHVKSYPSEYLSQSPVAGLLALRARHGLTPARVAAIRVRANERAVILTRASAYLPETRESADHSLPYCLAVALADGELTPRQFIGERWRDPALRAVMARIAFAADPALEPYFPERRPSIVTVETTDGQVFEETTLDPKGSPRNPMTEAELAAKFHGLADPLLGRAAAAALADRVLGLGPGDRIADLMAMTMAGER
jgi:2-methylcitrate dehydratase